MDRAISQAVFDRAQSLMPGGVNSPVRSFRALGIPPLLASHGQGPFIYDLDGNRFIDYLMCWGANILGHAHPELVQAITEASRRGTGFGLSTEVECELAEIVKEAFPSIDLLRLVNSGTEAVMSAVRLARGYTGRDKIIAFEGCYHGHSDGLLTRAGSGLITFAIPSSAGVPDVFTAYTLLARYNDLDSVEHLCRVRGDQIAAILVEPVAGNMGVVPPEPGFLPGLRGICDRTGSLLIFDEVITGFRIAWGGAQQKYGVQADLTTLGKIIGGGLPVGAFGGRQDIMEQLAPVGEVYQAGTLSGNPVVASAGKTALEILQRLDPYDSLAAMTTRLTDGLAEAAARAEVPLQIGQVGSMFTLFFADNPVTDYAAAKAASGKSYARFAEAMLNKGILMPPSPWEAGFVGVAHTEEEISATIAHAVEMFTNAEFVNEELGVGPLPSRA